ncbi:MAG: serine/threonine protein kinase [Labilithrix sp.]|nr:serine/threonine protein kinase [Labilithrix sp.]
MLRRLGEGSQGETYEARDNGVARGRPERPRPEALADDFQRYVTRARAGEARAPSSPPGGVVAIKRFRVGAAKAWKDVELAEREARTLASLDHPRLPRYVEHFEEDGALYLVMEKVEGESLAALRSRQRTLGAAEVTRMLEDLADALRYLHGRAPFIVHRDIKPGNVIRRLDGSYALVDFGAVRDRLKPAGGSTVVGTFGYMAPEQFQGRASPKSDVYGLGATALTMLTGCEPEELPHAGLGIDVARALPKGTSPALVRALSAMLQPDPDQRVDSVDEALAFLRAGAPARADTPAAPARLTRRRRSRGAKRENRRRRKRGPRRRRARRRSRCERRLAVPTPRRAAPACSSRSSSIWLTVGLLVPSCSRCSRSSSARRSGGRRARQPARREEEGQAALGRASRGSPDTARSSRPKTWRASASPRKLARVRSVTEHGRRRSRSRGRRRAARTQTRGSSARERRGTRRARRGAAASPVRRATTREATGLNGTDVRPAP